MIISKLFRTLGYKPEYPFVRSYEMLCFSIGRFYLGVLCTVAEFANASWFQRVFLNSDGHSVNYELPQRPIAPLCFLCIFVRSHAFAVEWVYSSSTPDPLSFSEKKRGDKKQNHFPRFPYLYFNRCLGRPENFQDPKELFEIFGEKCFGKPTEYSSICCSTSSL